MCVRVYGLNIIVVVRPSSTAPNGFKDKRARAFRIYCGGCALGRRVCGGWWWWWGVARVATETMAARESRLMTCGNAAFYEEGCPCGTRRQRQRRPRRRSPGRKIITRGPRLTYGRPLLPSLVGPRKVRVLRVRVPLRWGTYVFVCRWVGDWRKTNFYVSSILVYVPFLLVAISFVRSE